MGCRSWDAVVEVGVGGGSVVSGWDSGGGGPGGVFPWLARGPPKTGLAANNV